MSNDVSFAKLVTKKLRDQRDRMLYLEAVAARLVREKMMANDTLELFRIGYLDLVHKDMTRRRRQAIQGRVRRRHPRRVVIHVRALRRDDRIDRVPYVAIPITERTRETNRRMRARRLGTPRRPQSTGVVSPG